jgi:hypothetical protein
VMGRLHPSQGSGIGVFVDAFLIGGVLDATHEGRGLRANFVSGVAVEAVVRCQIR